MKLTRRTLFAAAAVPGASGRHREPSSMPKVYEQLGLKGCINANGYVTALGGSLMDPRVLEAMADAARAYVPISELHQAVGKRIASLTGAEAAMVSSGAAASIVLGTAACIAGADRERILRLPDTTGMKNEVLTPVTPGLSWTRYARSAGGVLVQFADASDLKLKITGRSAMILFIPALHAAAPIRLEELLEIRTRAGIPMMVDAAAEAPPPEKLRSYNEMKVDLVGFSGGKGIRGPQATGLLMGRKDLVEAAYLANNPNPGIGRPMKVGKEEMVGLLTALELYFQRDHAADQQRWNRQLQYIEARLKNISGVQLEFFNEPITGQGKRLAIQPPSGITAAEIQKKLWEGTPRIQTGARDKPNELVINPQPLQPGEERIIAARLLEMLKS